MVFKSSVVEAVNSEENSIILNLLEAQHGAADYALDKTMGLKIRKGIKSKDSLEPWFYDLAINRDTNSEKVKNGMARLLSNPEKFPKEYRFLVRILGMNKKDFSNQSVLMRLNDNEIKLLENWYNLGRDYGMCFCFYTDRALSKLLDFFSDVKINYSSNSIAKVYKRINLQKARNLLFKDVLITGDQFVPVPFRNKIMQ